MKSGSGKSSNLVGQSVLGSSKSITCSKVAAHIVLFVKSPGKSKIFLIVAEMDECSNSELLNGFYDSGGLLTNCPLEI